MGKRKPKDNVTQIRKDNGAEQKAAAPSELKNAASICGICHEAEAVGTRWNTEASMPIPCCRACGTRENPREVELEKEIKRRISELELKTAAPEAPLRTYIRFHIGCAKTIRGFTQTTSISEQGDIERGALDQDISNIVRGCLPATPGKVVYFSCSPGFHEGIHFRSTSGINGSGHPFGLFVADYPSETLKRSSLVFQRKIVALPAEMFARAAEEAKNETDRDVEAALGIAELKARKRISA